MAMFGKAREWICYYSCIGKKRSVMERTQNTFINGTFWTERAGSTAALKTP